MQYGGGSAGRTKATAKLTKANNHTKRVDVALLNCSSVGMQGRDIRDGGVTLVQLVAVSEATLGMTVRAFKYGHRMNTK